MYKVLTQHATLGPVDAFQQGLQLGQPRSWNWPLGPGRLPQPAPAPNSPTAGVSSSLRAASALPGTCLLEGPRLAGKMARCGSEGFQDEKSVFLLHPKAFTSRQLTLLM